MTREPDSTSLEEDIPILTHRNIVATVNLECRLDLKTIALHARNAEYNPKVCLVALSSLLPCLGLGLGVCFRVLGLGPLARGLGGCVVWGRRCGSYYPFLERYQRRTALIYSSYLPTQNGKRVHSRRAII